MSIRKFRFYWKCLSCYINYKLKRYKPILLVISPTVKCNLKCKYCSVHKSFNPAFPKYWESFKDADLEIDKLFSLIDEAHDLGIAIISFSGGEPLLIKGIEKVARYARGKGMIVNLNTNGTLLNRIPSSDIVNSFDQIRISLDGLEKTHDKLCGMNGTFNRVTKNLSRLKNIKGNTKIGLNLVINEENEKEIDSFVNYFKDKVDFISFLPRFDFNQCNNIPFKSFKQINHSESFKNFINREGFFTSRRLMKKSECDAGKLYLFIGPHNMVLPCPFLSEKGNMDIMSTYDYVYKKGNLKDIYNIFVQKKEFNCIGCRATCTSEISNVFRSSPIKLIMKFFNYKKKYRV